MSSNDNSNRPGGPENDPSNAMDNQRKVAQSPDEKTDEDFPGYPHYPAKEDIMDQRTGAHRVDASLEDMGTGPNASGVNQRFLAGQDNRQLSASNTDGNQSEEELNDEMGVPQNVSNDDLGTDLPGTDVDEAAEKGSTNP